MISFEDRAVAFLDVLGFKVLTNQAAINDVARSKLSQLVSLLDSVIPVLDAVADKTVPRQLIPEHTYISDSIILSAPLKVCFDGSGNYSGLDILVMRTIQVSQALLDQGYLVRGGIDVGPVWHTESNIVGPAYQNAYDLERKSTDRAPRILLSPDATNLWTSGGPSIRSRMCIDYRGALMVNSLHEYYVPARFNDDITAAFMRYEEVAADALNSGLGKSATEKWEWMTQYIAYERKNSSP
jgi:hypothetical protein